MVFFFLLKDKIVLMRSLAKYYRKNRRLATRVWFEMQQQLPTIFEVNFLEILIG